MTDPEKPKRNHGPLTAEQIVGKVRRLLASQPGRIDEAATEIRRVDAEKLAVYLTRAPSLPERRAALDMLRAVKLVPSLTEEPSEDPPESEPDVETRERVELYEPAAMAGAKAAETPVDELPKGAQRYPEERARIGRRR